MQKKVKVYFNFITTIFIFIFCIFKCRYKTNEQLEIPLFNIDLIEDRSNMAKGGEASEP